MVLYGYDASVFNSVQGSDNWNAWFNEPGPNVVGSINTAYTVGAIFGGFFLGGPTADFLGRKFGMGIGCVLVIIATFMQTFSPHHNIQSTTNTSFSLLPILCNYFLHIVILQ